MTTTTATTTTTTTTMTSSSSSTTTIHLHVEGMMCQRNCGTTVRCALEQIVLSSSSSEPPKVTFAEAVFAEERAAVTIQHVDENPSEATIQEWTEAAVDAVECVGFDAEPIDDLEDYLAEFRKRKEAEEKAAVAKQQPPPPPPPILDASPDTVTLQVSGMSCAVCTGRVERSLLRLPFARSASVDLATSRAVVHCDNNISMEEISLDESSSSGNNVLDEDDEARVARRRSSCQQAVTAAGYECKVLTAESNSVQAMQEAQKKEVRTWRNLLLYSLLFTVPLVVLDHVDLGSVGVWSKHVQKGHEHLHYEHHQHHDPTMMNSNNNEFDGNGGMPSSMMPSMMMMGNDSTNGGGGGSMDSDNGGANLNIGKQWILLLLAAAVQFGPSGRRFYKAAYKGWVHGPAVMGMDFLVVLGTTASFVYSVVVLFMLQWGPMVGGTIAGAGVGDTENGEGNLAMAAGGMHGGSGKGDEHLMPTFATGAMLLTFVTFGKFLEAYAKGKTASALQTLMELQPLQASKIVFDDSSEPPPAPEMWDNAFIAAAHTQDVSVENIRVGDYLRVLPGARIPADGVVVAVSSSSNNNSNDDAKGNGNNGVNMAYVDESAFTGEPFPVAKAPGKQVFASTVNQLSVLVVQVQATGNATALSQIVTLVQNAQASKAPIQDYADSVAGIFAPTVIGLAMITFAAWMVLNAASNERFFVAFTTAIAVIVVACPCTLGLATPTAVMVGTGVGATHGLLIKGGAALEKLHAVDTVVFDKTGTLTTGKAVLGRRISYVNNNGNDQQKNIDDDPLLRGLPSKVNAGNVALWLAACAETTSEHPLGKAVVNAAKSEFGSYDVTGANEGVAVENFAVVPGRGVECTVTNNANANNDNDEWGTWNVRVGNRAWTKETPPSNGLEDGKVAEKEDDDDDDATGDADVLELRRCGQIAVYVSVLAVIHRDGNTTASSSSGRRRRRIVGVFGIMDPVQAQAKSTVKALQNMGVDVWLCTGDHAVTARAVALQVGIDPETNVCASATPQGKEELVARLQQEGGEEEEEDDDDDQALHGNKGGYDYNKTAIDSPGRRRVAVVGDGINDAVALARADVGIAIGAGTSVAVEAADVVLVRSSLHDVVVALHMSAVVYRRILLNFVWAMSYNLVAVPFAAGVMYPFTEFRLPPELAGLMMAFSSVSVVTSSLLLRNYKRPTIAEDDGTLREEGGWDFLRNVVSCITCTGGNRTRRRQRQQQRRQRRRQRQQRRWRKQRSLSLSDGREAVYQGIPTKQVDIELI